MEDPMINFAKCVAKLERDALACFSEAQDLPRPRQRFEAGDRVAAICLAITKLKIELSIPNEAPAHLEQSADVSAVELPLMEPIIDVIQDATNTKIEWPAVKLNPLPQPNVWFVDALKAWVVLNAWNTVIPTANTFAEEQMKKAFECIDKVKSDYEDPLGMLKKPDDPSAYRVPYDVRPAIQQDAAPQEKRRRSSRIAQHEISAVHETSNQANVPVLDAVPTEQVLPTSVSQKAVDIRKEEFVYVID